MLKFSIIIPIYKVEPYLRACVDSVLSQTFRDFELILVDDGSPDACPQICDEYAQSDSRITVVHQQNAGLSCARNSGVAVARGEYLIFIDGDDFLSDADFLSVLSDKCKNAVDIVWYGYRKYFEADGHLGREVCAYPVELGNLSYEDGLHSLVAAGMYEGAVWTKAVRRTFLAESGIVFHPGMISEDIDWTLNVVIAAKSMDAVPRSFVMYRQRPGSISKAPKIKSLEDNLWILEIWPQRLKEKGLSPNLQNTLQSVLASYWANCLILCSLFSSSQLRPYWKRLRALSYLRRYALTRRARLISLCVGVFGIKITVDLLRMVSKIK